MRSEDQAVGSKTLKTASGWIVMLTTLVLLSGCGASASAPTAPSAGPVSSSSPSLPPASAAAGTHRTVASPSAATPISPQAPGGITVNSDGAVLPNHGRTPGAINPSVSQANIGQTICVSGWTSTIRPPSSFTTDLKVAQLASGYTYKGDTAPGDYEEDHLISLEIGGAPSAEANLWPEPYNAPEGARVKDVVENKLHTLVCDHVITLATAQRAIAANWWVAYQTYAGAAPDSSANQTPAAPAQPAPPSAAAPAPEAPGNGATALCKDGAYSFAAHHQGACSGHGGVDVFYK
jgi:hypothetical protein